MEHARILGSVSDVEATVQPRWFWPAFFLLLATALSPFLLCSPLPLGDYANHLARMHILSDLDSSANLSRFYSVQWAIVPNLAADIVVPWLARLHWVSIEASLALFTAFSLVLMASGTVVLNRVLFGRWSYLSLAVFLLLYNRHVLWGFLNYIFALGLMLWILSAWIYCRQQAWGGARYLFCIPVTALFLSHLVPLCIYGLCVMGYELSQKEFSLRHWQKAKRCLRELLISGVQFVPAAVLLFGFSPTTGRAGDTYSKPWMDKLVGLLDPFNNYYIGLDAATWLFLAALFAYGWYRKLFTVHKALRLPLLALLGLYVALPHAVLGSAGADRRLIEAVALLLVASMGEWRLPPRKELGLLCVLGVLFIVRMSAVGWNWTQADAIYAKHLAGMDRIETGARVAYLESAPDSPWLLNPPIEHLGNLMIVRRDAFVNGLFADSGHQVVVPKYNTDTEFSRHPSNSFRFASKEERAAVLSKLPLERFDWVYIINTKYFPGAKPERMVLEWRDDSIDTALYRIVPTTQSLPITASPSGSHSVISAGGAS
jgi:hypothetical protein